jgi:hypothetical protein
MTPVSKTRLERIEKALMPETKTPGLVSLSDLVREQLGDNPGPPPTLDSVGLPVGFLPEPPRADEFGMPVGFLHDPPKEEDDPQ